jgi:hypothetical protein
MIIINQKIAIEFVNSSLIEAIEDTYFNKNIQTIVKNGTERYLEINVFEYQRSLNEQNDIEDIDFEVVEELERLIKKTDWEKKGISILRLREE